MQSKVTNGSGTTAQVSNFCGKASKQIDPHLVVVGRNGKQYNLRDAFLAAENLNEFKQASTAVNTEVGAPPAPATPPPPDPWTTTLQPQLQYLEQLVGGNSNPCGDHTNACLTDLGTAITAAETAPAPPLPAVPDFVVGSRTMGRDGKHPLFGATLSTTIAPPATPAPVAGATPAPGASVAPVYTAVTTLTLSASNNLYNAFTVTQSFGVGNPVSYEVMTEMGSQAGNHQVFHVGPITGSSLKFPQSQTQGGAFQFCPQLKLPLASGFWFSVDASASCDGLATLNYDIDLRPTVGYVRIVPNVDLKLRGSVTATVVVISGTAEADVTIASLNGGAGMIYGTFNEPGYGQMVAIRPFAYYNADAFSVDVVATIKAFFGARLASRKFHVYDGIVLQPLQVNSTTWSVNRVLSTSH